MPIHDWTKADDGLFHFFHNTWATHLAEALNSGVLPEGYFAMSDQRVGAYIPDVLTSAPEVDLPSGGGIAVTKPRTDRRVAIRDKAAPRVGRRIVVRNPRRVVGVIELVSPGNKDGSQRVREFAEKVADLLRGDVNVAVIDLLPPGKSNPGGMHVAICKAMRAGRKAAEPPPPDRPLTFAGYTGGPLKEAYLSYAAVGQEVPTVPLYLRSELFVNLPLEESYMIGFRRLPVSLRASVE